MKCYDIDKIEEIVKKENKNKIAIDIHKDAINFNNKTKINDSIVIFGYELVGIPKCLLDYCNLYLQIESKKSINVIAVLSIFLFMNQLIINN